VHNRITDLSSISTLSTLQFLDVSNNNIGHLNLTTFAELKNLLTLSLGYTNISNLEYGTFSHHPKLTRLDISYNSLGQIDLNMFTSLTSLEKLFLDGNDLTEIAYDDIKHSLPKLTEISLSDNNWNCSYLTAVMKKLNSVQVEIKIDATKFVSNTTNQKGIACNNTKAVHWKTPVIRFDPATAGAINSTEILEMTRNIDKLIASFNTTEITDDLRNDIKQLQEKLQFLEKNLNEQGMTIVKTQLQVATANSTVQSQTLSDIHSIVEQLNNLTLQRQQLNNDILSQKMYELNFNVDRNAKSVERLEAMLKLANIDNGNNNNYKNYQQFNSNAGALTNAQTGNGAGQMSIWTVLLVVAMAIAMVFVGFQAMTYLKRQRRRAMAFSNRTSTVTLEQSI
jgi:Leucine-rich repeat (LRR) protein